MFIDGRQRALGDIERRSTTTVLTGAKDSAHVATIVEPMRLIDPSTGDSVETSNADNPSMGPIIRWRDTNAPSIDVDVRTLRGSSWCADVDPSMVIDRRKGKIVDDLNAPALTAHIDEEPDDEGDERSDEHRRRERQHEATSTTMTTPPDPSDETDRISPRLAAFSRS